jgi:uncharacterized protein
MRRSRSLSAVKFAALALVLAFAAQSVRAVQTSKDLTVVGRLTPTVEAGGWLVVAEYGRYLLLNANQFRAQPWFREGATVEATGRVRDDVMSIHMQGVPFQARTLRARGGAAATRNAGTQPSAPGAQPQQPVTAGLQPRVLTRVIVSGDALVNAEPDTAVLTLAVVTQNASASEAQAENASKTEAVVRAVRAAAGAGAEVRTSGYSVQPQFVYKEGAPPTITGYVVRNAVTVTTGELTRVGRVIDAASAAGANSVDGLAFTLRRDEQAQQRALADATREALAKARLIATTLGGRVVRIVEVQESGTVRPIPVYEREAGNIAMARQQASTPIETGSLEIRAQVQLVAEVETRE